MSDERIISKTKIKYILFIILEILLFLILIFLTKQILNLARGKVKGIQYTTIIKKEDITFNHSDHLKNFYEPKPNSVETWVPDWLGYDIKININSDTINSKIDFSIQKPNNTFRIITLEDSFTFGQYVSTLDNYPQILEDLLNRNLKCSEIKHFEVVNLGVSGYDLEYSYTRFIKRGIKYSPDLVIWLVNKWNFMNVNEYSTPFKDKLKKEGIQNFDLTTGKHTLSDLIYQYLRDKFGEQSVLDYQKSIISKIRQQYSGYLLFTSFPTLADKHKSIIKNFIASDSSARYFDNLIDIQSDNSLQVPDGHPNKVGYRKIAEDVFEYLSSHFLNNCILKN